MILGMCLESVCVAVSAVMAQLAKPLDGLAEHDARDSLGDSGGAARSGGRCLLAFDVASSRELPALAEQRQRAPDELSEFVHDALDAGALHLRPDPGTLVAQLASPGMRSLVSEPRLSEPWSVTETPRPSSSTA